MQPRLFGALFMAVTVLGGCADLDQAANSRAIADTHEVARASQDATDIQVFASTALGEAVRVRIAPPAGDPAAGNPAAGDSAGPWPVIYVLDGALLFGLVTDTVRLLELSGAVPACIVVGIDVGSGHGGTPGTGLDGTARGRHFTPSESTVPEHATGLQRAGAEHGGAATFLDFLTGELSLFVAAQYPIDTNRRVLVGDGLAGLFVAYAFFASDAFTHFLAVSPALWWGDGSLLREEAAFAARSDDRKAALFFAVGADETDTAGLALVSNVETLTGRLRARGYPSLRSETVIFEGESAGSVTPAAISRGLRFLLPAQ